MPTIYSTLTGSTKFVRYQKKNDPRAPNVIIEGSEVVIRGGSGLVNARGETVTATATVVTDEQLATLKADPIFNKQLRAGYFRIEDGDTIDDATTEKIGGEMTQRDGSSPETDATLLERTKAVDPDSKVTINSDKNSGRGRNR